MCVLGSFEIPLSQYLIEEQWSSFFYDVGINSANTLADRTLGYFCQSYSSPLLTHYEITILPSSALYGTVTAIDPSFIQFTTVEPHGITENALPYLQAGALVAPFPAPPPNTVPHPVTSIVSPTEFRTDFFATVIGAPTALVVTNAGNLPFQNITQLLGVMNQNLRGNSIPLEFSYNDNTMQLCLNNYSQLQPEICQPCLIPCQQRQECGVEVTPTASLLTFLNFSAFMNTQCFPTCSGQFPYNLCQVTLPPGQYSESTLRSAMEARMDIARCGVLPSGGMQITIMGAGTYSFTIMGATFIYPTQVAAAISAQLAAQWGASGLPAPAQLQVVYANDSFTIQNFNTPPLPYMFTITWIPDPTVTEQLYQRLGFDSNIALSLSATGCPRSCTCSLPVTVQLPMSLCGTNIAVPAKYIFKPVPILQVWPPPVIFPPGSFPLNPFLSINVTATEIWSFIYVPIGTLVMTSTAFLRATRLGTIAGQSVILYMYIEGNPPLPIGVYPGIPFFTPVAAVNIYFPTPVGACWSRLSEIVGFVSGANQWPSGNSIDFQAPYRWTLDSPFYLLLDLGLSHMSMNCVQRCHESLRANIFAKIVLYPPFKTEKNYMQGMSGTGTSVITSFHVRIYNPWGTLYNFHGRNFSFTIVSGSGRNRAVTECP
jgi:hypothetical protein